MAVFECLHCKGRFCHHPEVQAALRMYPAQGFPALALLLESGMTIHYMTGFKLLPRRVECGKSKKKKKIQAPVVTG